MLTEKLMNMMKGQSLKVEAGHVVYEPPVGGKYVFVTRLSSDPTDEEIKNVLTSELPNLYQANHKIDEAYENVERYHKEVLARTRARKLAMEKEKAVTEKAKPVVEESKPKLRVIPPYNPIPRLSEKDLLILKISRERDMKKLAEEQKIAGTIKVAETAKVAESEKAVKVA